MSLILNGTNGVSDVDGSASTPAVRGTDTNTGIFFPAADTIAFAEGGAEVARFDSSGNLGVGTNSPSTYGSKLAVYDAGGNGVLAVGQGTSYSQIQSNGFDLYINQNVSGAGSNAGSTIFRRGGSQTESMRIDSSGNLLVGTTSTGVPNANSFCLRNDGLEIISHINGSSSGNGYVLFGYNGSTIGTITQNGTTAVAYNTTSDYRLKENVVPIQDALAKVQALKPCTYTWKSAPDEIGEGFIAHELAEVCPQAVTGEKDAVNQDGSIKAQSIDTSFLVATLTAAIQEQQAIITEQSLALNELKTRIEALEQA
jgi:hypothetical protein